MKINLIKSANFDKRRRFNSQINFIIIHYTGMQSKRVSIERLKSSKHKVSCHYLIDKKGQLVQMVHDLYISWHAGKSKWKNFNNLNKNSIGIELVNKGHKLGYENFTKIQINNLIKLFIILKKKYKIKDTCILGHSDIAPLRKSDPGEKFPWAALKKRGLGIWYPELKKNDFKFSQKEARKFLFQNLYRIGYRYFSKLNKSKKDKVIIKAFQSRFLPNNVDGKINQKTLKISDFLAKAYKN